MDKDPSVIRAEIAQTRDRVGDEVDALSYKTDVTARVGDYVDDKTEAVKSKLTGAVDSVTNVIPDQRTIARGASHVRDTAESNPLGLVLGGLAVGFLIGTLLPSTQLENEQLGETSDRLDRRRQGNSERCARPRQAGRPAGSRSRRRHREERRPRAGPGVDIGPAGASARPLTDNLEGQPRCGDEAGVPLDHKLSPHRCSVTYLF